MYILITNDDGVYTEGLRLLTQCAIRHGHRVMVCAPAVQQSAASQHIHLNRPLMAEQVSLLPEAESWAVSGTPADCVRIALELSKDVPDVCISGINDGENAGCAVFYSGTVAAAREAAMHGIPAFAVSIMPGADTAMLEGLAEEAIHMVETSRLDAFPRLAVVNLNAPAIPRNDWEGIRLCPVSQAFYLDRYEHRVSPRGQHYFWLSNGLPMEAPEPGSDYDWLNRHYATVSVLGGNTCLHDRVPVFLPTLNDAQEAEAHAL